MNFKILEIDIEQKSIYIDWLNGVRLVHNIPLYILENPDLPRDRVIEEIENMRVDPPEPVEIPDVLFDLMEGQEGFSYKSFLPYEGFIKGLEIDKEEEDD